MFVRIKRKIAADRTEPLILQQFVVALINSLKPEKKKNEGDDLPS